MIVIDIYVLGHKLNRMYFHRTVTSSYLPCLFVTRKLVSVQEAGLSYTRFDKNSVGRGSNSKLKGKVASSWTKTNDLSMTVGMREPRSVAETSTTNKT